jgi:hypothetical protein
LRWASLSGRPRENSARLTAVSAVVTTAVATHSRVSPVESSRVSAQAPPAIWANPRSSRKTARRRTAGDSVVTGSLIAASAVRRAGMRPIAPRQVRRGQRVQALRASSPPVICCLVALQPALPESHKSVRQPGMSRLRCDVIAASPCSAVTRVICRQY